METELQTVIHSATDVVTARQCGRSLALELGFNGADVTLIPAAISEVARNIVDHAKKEEIVMSSSSNGMDASNLSWRAGRIRDGETMLSRLDRICAPSEWEGKCLGRRRRGRCGSILRMDNFQVGSVS
jgi:anti-sigma regulatory factor (Ser/Thr protein kinase)